MKIYFESYEYLTEEDLLEASSKTDFRDKFGQQALDNFDKARQRLKNKGMSVDYGQYLKMTPDELNNLILSLYDDEKDAQKKRVLQGKDKEIRGKYNYIGEYGGFKIYEPLDAQASMDLGVNTGWCTTGRYGHAGHPEYTPSVENAEEHFNDYTSKGIRLFYFLNPKTMYGEWALALYNKVIYVDKVLDDSYIDSTNFEIFDAMDNLNYSGIEILPLDKLNVKILLNYYPVIDGLAVDSNGTLLKCDSSSSTVNIPDSVTKIDKFVFYESSVKSVTIPDSVIEIGSYAFEGSDLKSVRIPKSVVKIGRGAFNSCASLKSALISANITEISSSIFYDCSSLKSIKIPNNITKIGEYAFNGCVSLKSISIPNSVTEIGDYAFFGCYNLESLSLPKRFSDDTLLNHIGLGWIDKSKIKFT